MGRRALLLTIALCTTGCFQPSDIEGARTRGWEVGTSQSAGDCEFVLASGWLKEEGGWSGTVEIDARNTGTSTASCTAVMALVDAIPKPTSVESKTFVLKTAEESRWRVQLSTPHVTNVATTGGWVYVGLRADGVGDEVGYKLLNLPQSYDL